MSDLSFRRAFHLAPIAAAAALLAAPAAQASTFMDTLSTVSQTYNLYVSGDLGKASSPNAYSDVEGRVAAGGDAYLQGYDIGAKTPGGDVLIVGDDLKFQSGSIHGNVVTGGKANFPSNSGGATVAGTVSAGGGMAAPPTSYAGAAAYSGLPIDFGSISADLSSASSYLKSAAALSQGSVGQATKAYGGLTLTSHATGLVFFNLAASDLVGINSLKFDVDPTATVIINLAGQAGGTFSNYGFLGDYQKDQTLFNFVDATSLGISGLGFMGSILAPNADLTGDNGQINGSVMAKSFAGGAQLNWTPFSAALPTAGAIPEPSSWAMMILGIGGVGAVLRRRRRLAAATTPAQGRTDAVFMAGNHLP